MIDPDLLATYSDDEQKMLKSAFITLSSSGILIRQVERLFTRVAEGSDIEFPSDLNKKIMEYRWKAAGLRTLQQVGESFLKEQKT